MRERLSAPARRWAWLAACGAACAASLPARAADTDSIAPTLGRLQHIQREVGRSELVPEEARVLIPRLKLQLRDVVLDVLRSQDAQRIGAGRARQAALARLAAAGVTVGWADDSPPKEGFFAVGDIDLHEVPGHGGLIALTTTLVSDCCGDTSFYLIDSAGPGLRVVLSVETNGYEEISGAQGSLSYAISPSDARGDFFVVLGYVSPWCQSNWQGLTFKAMRVGPDADHPRAIGEGRRVIYIGVNPPLFKLSADKGGFTFRYRAGSLDGDRLTREHVLRYAVDGDRWERTAPLARNAQDFVDEWLDELPWSEAARWTKAASREALAPWHAVFKRMGEEPSLGPTFAFSRRVAGSPKTYEVGLSIEPLSGESGQPSPRAEADRRLIPEVPTIVCFTVIDDGSGFLMQDARNGCRR